MAGYIVHHSDISLALKNAYCHNIDVDVMIVEKETLPNCHDNRKDDSGETTRLANC